MCLQEEPWEFCFGVPASGLSPGTRHPRGGLPASALRRNTQFPPKGQEAKQQDFRDGGFESCVTHPVVWSASETGRGICCWPQKRFGTAFLVGGGMCGGLPAILPSPQRLSWPGSTGTRLSSGLWVFPMDGEPITKVSVRPYLLYLLWGTRPARQKPVFSLPLEIVPL